MSTLKLKKNPAPSGRKRATPKAPLRRTGLQHRPTLAEKEAERSVRKHAPARHGRNNGPFPSASNTAFDTPARPAPWQATPERPAQPRPPRPSPRPLVAEKTCDMRLSKRMSELGLASRREADEWIEKGWVRVDGKVVNQLGSRVRPGQMITVDTPAKFHQARKVTVLLNKPVGYVSGQAEDGHEPAWVLVRPENQWREDTSGIRFVREHTRGLAPAGRLDIDSVGLLVMTQDGRIAKQLIGEDSTVEKEYLVRVEPAQPERTLSPQDLALLNHGLSLDGVELRPARVEWAQKGVLRFVLQEGRKRQIRRMCEAVGLKVTHLQRLRIGNVTLGELPPGKWRYLRGNEAFQSAS